MNEQAVSAKAPKYLVNIEGVDHPWDQDTITVPEIRRLGNVNAG